MIVRFEHLARYIPRIVEAEIQAKLGSLGAVVVEGPKACGKTETARRLASSAVLLDTDRNARQAVSVDPGLVLEGPVPRLIDEWQVEPEIWNHIRRAVDERGVPGQFILTGSAAPADDVTRHTGAGRIARVRMRPMSLHETGHASGTVSLAALLRGEPPRAPDPGLTFRDLVGQLAVGGWPGLIGLDPDQALIAVRDYLGEIRRVDIRGADGRRRDPERVARVLRSLARHVSTYAAATTIAADAGGDERSPDDDTVRDYLDALERVMIVEDQPAWGPHLRSRSVLRSSVKRHFVDPSLAVAAVRATPERLLRDLEFTGLLFESLVVRDLRVYAQANEARVLQHRDNTGLEIDAIIETADGRWAAFEIKMGQRYIEDAAAALRRFAERVDTGRVGPPASLAVIVAGGYGYMRDDGIGVIPVAALGP